MTWPTPASNRPVTELLSASEEAHFDPMEPVDSLFVANHGEKLPVLNSIMSIVRTPEMNHVLCRQRPGQPWLEHLKGS